MIALRLVVVVLFVAIAGYTGVVVAHHGVGFVPIALGDLARLGWPGQFDLDFLCLLALSGLWVARRHRFRPAGIVLGLGAFFGGALFLTVYIFVATFRCGGRVDVLLLGEDADAPARELR